MSDVKVAAKTAQALLAEYNEVREAAYAVPGRTSPVIPTVDAVGEYLRIALGDESENRLEDLANAMMNA